MCSPPKRSCANISLFTCRLSILAEDGVCRAPRCLHQCSSGRYFSGRVLQKGASSSRWEWLRRKQRAALPSGALGEESCRRWPLPLASLKGSAVRGLLPRPKAARHLQLSSPRIGLLRPEVAANVNWAQNFQEQKAEHKISQQLFI